MNRPLSIGLVTLGDARNPRSWSGTVFHMARALEEHGAGLAYIGPMQTGALWPEKGIAQLRRKIGLSKTVPTRTPRAARLFAQQITSALSGMHADVLLSPAGSVTLARLPPGIPAIYTSDATSALMREYYPSYAAQSARTLRETDRLERDAIARADLLLYPTNWAAASAVADYGADPKKIRIVPYGANSAAPERAHALADRPPGPLQLLFVGVNWVRKGGEIAIDALDKLISRGIDARLTVIGCIPPDTAMRPQVSVIPFLDKIDPKQREQLSECYLGADFLLLPTRQECYGIVFCEAAAHGVPSITTATGGVPDVVHENVTGRTLPPEATGADFATTIEAALSAPGGLSAFRARARDDYESRLNWNAWATNTTAFMNAAVDKAT